MEKGGGKEKEGKAKAKAKAKNIIGECTIVAVAGGGSLPRTTVGAVAFGSAGGSFEGPAGSTAGTPWPLQLVNRASVEKVLGLVKREGICNCLLARLQFDPAGRNAGNGPTEQMAAGEAERRLQPILAKLAQKQRLGTNYVSNMHELAAQQKQLRSQWENQRQGSGEGNTSVGAGGGQNALVVFLIPPIQGQVTSDWEKAHAQLWTAIEDKFRFKRQTKQDREGVWAITIYKKV
jgi:hypothetical protein